MLLYIYIYLIKIIFKGNNVKFWVFNSDFRVDLVKTHNKLIILAINFYPIQL